MPKLMKTYLLIWFVKGKREKRPMFTGLVAIFCRSSPTTRKSDIHFRQPTSHSMSGQVLATTETERDIGVLVSAGMKPARQCLKAAQMAGSVLGQISRAFHYRDRKTFVKLFKQYVRPHLEFAVTALYSTCCRRRCTPWTRTTATNRTPACTCRML